MPLNDTHKVFMGNHFWQFLWFFDFDINPRERIVDPVLQIDVIGKGSQRSYLALRAARRILVAQKCQIFENATFVEVKPNSFRPFRELYEIATICSNGFLVKPGHFFAMEQTVVNALYQVFHYSPLSS